MSSTRKLNVNSEKNIILYGIFEKTEIFAYSFFVVHSQMVVDIAGECA